MTGTEAVMKNSTKALALIVDDGPGIKELLSEKLARAGIETAAAGTAEEAEEAFGKLCPDIILVDYSLPGRSGLQLIEDLRGKAEAKGCEELPPFIVITGHGDERLAVEMMKLGAADYLVKDPEFLSKVGPAAARALRESRTRRLLRESETRFRTLFDCGNDAIFVHPFGGDGAPGKFTEVNAVACSRLGYTREELLDMGPADVDADGMDDRRRQALEKLSSGGHAIFSMTHRRKDGATIPVEISASRFESAAGTFVVSICRDMTERVKAEDDLRRGEERYRSLLENLPDIVMNFDREYRHTFVSSNVAEIGMGPELFPGKTHAELGFAPELCRFFEEKLRSVFGSGDPLETEFEVDLPAGRRMFSWRLAPQFAPDGSVASVTSLARDITEYRSLAADYRQLFETMLDGFALHEMIFDDRGRPDDYRFLRLNPAFERLTGLKAAETEGRTASEILKDGAREWVEIYGRVAATGEAARFEKYSEPLGRYYDILAFRPRPGQFATIFKDITEQKRAETALRESEAMLRVAGRLSRFGGWSVDLAAGVCHWSDEVAAIHEEPAGFSPPVEKGIAYYAPEYRDRITEVFGVCAREGVPYDEEMEILTAKGNRRWIRTIGEAERDAAGKIVRVGGSFQDISDRKRMELALRDSEETFRQLVEHSPDGIFIQLEEKLEYLNPEALRMFGARSEKELRGTSIFGRFHPDFIDKVRERVVVLTREKRRVPEIEEVCLRLDGSRFPALVSAVPYERGGRSGAIVTIRDITERKRMQEDLLKSQKIESLGTLAGGIAHDFNNILTGITANLSLLLSKTGRGGEEGEALNEALAAANTAKGLTRQLLAFAEGGKPVKKEIDAGSTVAEAARLALRGSQCGLELRIAPDLWSVEADATQLSQVVVNLVTNAVQAMPGGGRLAVSAGNAERGGAPFIEVAVADTGTGIPEKYLKNIFDPYFTTKKQGHGLGLSMSYSIVKGHGGEISVRSESGQGSTFTVALPATGRRPAAPAAAAAAPETGTGRVLVMDDEEVVLKAARRMITSLGYECELAEDGTAALKVYEAAIAAGKPFDAVIMDITIQGGMGGREAVTGLRKKHPGAKVIASSGYAAGTPVSEYAAMGFDGLLAKPYNYEEMAALLKKLIGGK